MADQNVKFSSRLTHDYEFSWTINNFSFSPVVIRGPSMRAIPGFSGNLGIELELQKGGNDGTCYYSSMVVYLKNLNDTKHQLSVESRTSFRNTKDEIIGEGVASIKKFKESFRLLVHTHGNVGSYINKPRLSNNMKLLDDKLVVKGRISISFFITAKDEHKVCAGLRKDFKTSDSSSDVEFSVGDKTLRAHKAFLKNRSPVFAKMFGTHMVESVSYKVVIEDTDFHSFNCFLTFFYTGVLEDKNWKTVLSMYSLAHRYQVKCLHALCSRTLANSLTIDSVCKCLEISHLHGDRELKGVAKVFIKNRLLRMAGMVEWLELVSSHPQLVKEVVACKTTGE